jgi:DHA3 family macrolide efflux protein-like MFS transporter
MVSVFSLLEDREYRKYAAATMLTSLGNGMQFIAMSWFLYKMTGKASSIGWILIISTLPGLLFSPWIGPLIDRWNTQRICVVTDFLRGAILFFVALAMYFNALSVELIYLSTFLVSICNNFFQPAVSVLVRSIVMKDRLLNANIIGNISMQVGMLGGASVGGLLVAQFGAAVVIFINVASFFVSGLLTWWIRPAAAAAVAADSRRPGILREFRGTFDYVRDNRALIWLAIQQMFIYIMLYICNTLLPIFVDKELASDASGFGLIDAAWGVGAMIGGLSLSRIVAKIDRRHLGVIGLVLTAGALFVFLTARAVPQSVMAYFALGFLACVIRVNTDTIIVTEVDPVYFGRVKATISMFISYMSLLVYAVVGYTADKISVRWIYLGLCLLILGAAGIAMMHARRKVRDVGLTPETE